MPRCTPAFAGISRQILTLVSPGGLPAAARAGKRLASCSSAAPGGAGRKGHILARAPVGVGRHGVGDTGGGKGTVEKAL
jgi:hypothetical protein